MQAILLTFFLLIGFGQDSYTFYSLTKAKKYPDQVELLILNKQKIRSVPDSLFIFPYLKELDLSKNRIDFLTAEIGDYAQLERLVLSDNQISVVPPQIGKLVNLKELDLSRNKIEELPDEIGKLEYLELLTLHGNSITRLPESVELLVNLKVLDLRQMEVSEEQLKSLHSALPETKILFTVQCACGF
jgi:Leucine-rich repeat (LRR) protein